MLQKIITKVRDLFGASSNEEVATTRQRADKANKPKRSNKNSATRSERPAKRSSNRRRQATTRSGSGNQVANSHQEFRIQRSDHGISRDQIDKSALDVLYQLKRAGYEAYLVGGGVRDLLLGIEPKDFDVVTDALPEEIKDIFKNRCMLIGRRFRLAHVRFGHQIIEVATFRGEDESAAMQARQTDADGRLVRDNVYGTLEEDIWRRDFTVNSMYYDISDFSIVDYSKGMADLLAGQIRLIGDPNVRYREDPVRMIRAVRFAAKLGFNIEPQTEKPLYELGELLTSVSNARMFEEVLKLFHSGVGVQVYEKLKHYDLFKHLFPLTDQLLTTEKDCFPRQVVLESLKSTDRRIAEGKSVNPAFLFAAFLWEPVLQAQQELMEQEGMVAQDALYAAANQVLDLQIKHTAIPRRLTAQMRDIWSLQFRLQRYQGARAQQLRSNRRFRAAYDFIGVRINAGETQLQPLFDWWTEYQEKNPIDQVRQATDLDEYRRDSRRRPPRKNRNIYRRRRED